MTRSTRTSEQNPWTLYEEEAQAALLRGEAVVCSVRGGKAGQYTRLIEWAKERDLFIYCGRAVWRTPWKESVWHNPYIVGKHGDREEVCRKYAEYLDTRPDLLARLPELTGRLLGCWCAPEQCHCDELARRANALGAERK